MSVGSGTFFEKDGDFEFGWDTVVNALVEAATETERTHEASTLPPSTTSDSTRMRCIAIDDRPDDAGRAQGCSQGLLQGPR